MGEGSVIFKEHRESQEIIILKRQSNGADGRPPDRISRQARPIAGERANKLMRYLEEPLLLAEIAKRADVSKREAEAELRFVTHSKIILADF
jgi:hypothetical protein